MLKKENRLKKKKEFNYIYRKGKVFYTKFFKLYVVSTKSKFCKVGFSINNKIGNSVVRHKLKRRLSEIVKDLIFSLQIKNYVLVAVKGVELLDFEQLTIQVEQIFKKALENETI